MKIKIQFKCPDAVHTAVSEYLHNNTKEIKSKVNHPDIEYEDVYSDMYNSIVKKLEKFVKYQEYVEIEFDLDNDKATVIPARGN